MLQVSRDLEDTASRQSVGFEALKKFSTDRKTVAAFDVQARLVRRDGFVSSPNDMEGMEREGWFLEYHNLYADIYDIAPGDVGRVNARAGRFYLPFGLNLQTDTHGTILQLSNEENFGFERDWYAGLWGNATKSLRYDVYFLAGSGYELKFKGQHGLGGARISLGNSFLSDYGAEGGLSFLAGERLSHGGRQIQTSRTGLDGRVRTPFSAGLVTWTSELSAGRDDDSDIYGQLHQLDYLHATRRWGLAGQFRRFDRVQQGTDSALFFEGTWYFRNDISGSNLHWIKLNVELQTQQSLPRNDVIWTAQYYHYW